MASRQERIKELEEEIRTTKYNKRTQHAVGLLKAKLSRLKEDAVKKSSAGKAQGVGYSVKKSGDASVVLLGFPSVGKSTLLNKLCGTKSPVAAYAFTTLDVIPGAVVHKQAKIQILDVPGIVYGAATGKGRGREVLSVIRSADLILMVIDALNPQQFHAIQDEVRESGIRLNQRPPQIRIKKKEKGGVDVSATVKLTKIDKETVKGMCRAMNYTNADVVLKEDMDIDRFLDALEGNKVYIPGILAINKVDLITKEEKEHLQKTLKPDMFISSHEGTNMTELLDMIYDRLNFIRVYLKEVSKKPDMEEPLIMRKGSTVKDICNKLHRDFVKKFKYIRLWGPSAKFDGQMIKSLKREVKDKDIVEIHLI